MKEKKTKIRETKRTRPASNKAEAAIVSARKRRIVDYNCGGAVSAVNRLAKNHPDLYVAVRHDGEILAKARTVQALVKAVERKHLGAKYSITTTSRAILHGTTALLVH